MEDGYTFLSAVLGHVAGFDMRSRCVPITVNPISDVLIGRERYNVLAATMVAAVASYCEAQRLSSFFARQVGQTPSICAFEVPRMCGSMLPSTLIRRVVCRLVSMVHEMVSRETMRDERVFQIFWLFSWSQSGRLPRMSLTLRSSRKTCRTLFAPVLQVCLTPRVLRHAARFFLLRPCCLTTRPCDSASHLWSFLGKTVDHEDKHPNRWSVCREPPPSATAGGPRSTLIRLKPEEDACWLEAEAVGKTDDGSRGVEMTPTQPMQR